MHIAAPKTMAKMVWPRAPLTTATGAFGCLVVDQHAKRRSVEIVELSAGGRPEEGDQAEEAEKERDGDEDGDDAHRATLNRRRAFTTTSTEDPDIASAAISGVT